MPGIRIQHPTERNQTYTLVDGSRPYKRPFECPACHRIHEFKTYHFRLDETGSAIVSIEIYERLKRIGNHRFGLGNVVEKPPAQRITL